MALETGSSEVLPSGRQVTLSLKNPSFKSTRNIIVGRFRVKSNLN